MIDSISIADMLRDIPSWDAEPQTLTEIAAKYVSDMEAARAVAELLNAGLALCGVLDVDGEGESRRVRTCSAAATYFVNSVAECVKHGVVLFDDWLRVGANEWPDNVGDLFRGPQALYLLESRRHAIDTLSLPIRTATVVKIVIKRRAGLLNRRDEYLTQFDSGSHAFQMIGGHKRGSDPSVLEAAKREIAEELDFAHLRFGESYTLEPLTVLEFDDVSLTYGALTRYTLHYYQMRSVLRDLRLRRTDVWLRWDELITGYTRRGERINEPALFRADENIPGRFVGLPSSFDA